jgi:hypothetical protein
LDYRGRAGVEFQQWIAVEDGSGVGDSNAGLPNEVDVRNVARVHFVVLRSGKTRAERYSLTMNKSRTTSEI